MIVTSSKTDQNQQHSVKESIWIRSARWLGVVLMKLPFLRRVISRTAGGMLGKAIRCIKEKKYHQALKILYAGMEKYRWKSDSLGHYYWWSFMSNAVYCANLLNDEQEKERLMAMAANGMMPLEGYPVAYCFCYFSRWMYYWDDYESAIYFAKRAITADPTSAEAHFLLGWYILATGSGDDDPVVYFKAAIAQDLDYLTIIAHDAVCMNHPDVINRLTALRLIKTDKQ